MRTAHDLQRLLVGAVMNQSAKSVTFEFPRYDQAAEFYDLMVEVTNQLRAPEKLRDRRTE